MVVSTVRPRDIDNLRSGVDPFMVSHEEQQQLTALPGVLIVMRFLPGELSGAYCLDHAAKLVGGRHNSVSVCGAALAMGQ